MPAISPDKIGSCYYLNYEVRPDHFDNRPDDQAKAFINVNYMPNGLEVRVMDGVPNKDGYNLLLMHALLDGDNNLTYIGSGNYHETVDFAKVKALESQPAYQTHWPLVERNNFIKAAPALHNLLSQMDPDNYLVEKSSVEHYDGSTAAHPDGMRDRLLASIETILLHPRKLADINFKDIITPHKPAMPPAVRPAPLAPPRNG